MTESQWDGNRDSSHEIDELAALAIGFQVSPRKNLYGDGLWRCFTTDRSQTGYLWRPEYDQADSDMLGVALEMNTLWCLFPGEVEVSIYGGVRITESHDGTLNGKAKTLSLARLRVAAEVGKRMKEKEHEPTD